MVFGFGRRNKKRKSSAKGTARTFVEATGGGWEDTPDIMAADGGANADYVSETLRRASEYARTSGVAVGEEFEFTLTDIPRGIASPHEIVFGLLTRAGEYGLIPGVVHDEKAHFVRAK